MCRSLFRALSLVLLAGLAISAQNTESGRLEVLFKDVLPLPVDRIDLPVNPPVTFVGISAVSADKRGNIYVIHRPAEADPIVVLDSKGKVIRSWGKGLFTIPHGIRVDPSGDVWAIDAHTSMVYKFTGEGKKLLEIDVGSVPDLTKDFCGATDVAFGKNGHVFVADGYCNARVIEYDSKGTKVNEWGKHGKGPGEFDHVHSIAMSPDGRLYIADRENGRVQWFEPNGKFLGQYTYINQLFSIAFGPKGEFYAAVRPNGATSRSGAILKVDLGTSRILGKTEAFAHELAVAPDGSLLPGGRESSVLVLRPNH